MSEQQLDCALDLMRRLPPQHIEKNLSQVEWIDKSWTLSTYLLGQENLAWCVPAPFENGNLLALISLARETYPGYNDHAKSCGKLTLQFCSFLSDSSLLGLLIIHIQAKEKMNL